MAASVDVVSEALARGCGSRGLVRASLFEQHGFVRLLELPPPSSSSQFPLLQVELPLFPGFNRAYVG